MTPADPPPSRAVGDAAAAPPATLATAATPATEATQAKSATPTAAEAPVALADPTAPANPDTFRTPATQAKSATAAAPEGAISPATAADLATPAAAAAPAAAGSSASPVDALAAVAPGPPPPALPTVNARRLRVAGVVQGVGFRPFVYRLARDAGVTGWVRNGAGGVEIHVEGHAAALDRFVARLQAEPPAAARISQVEIAAATATGAVGFHIHDSAATDRPTARIAPDLPVCDACLAELADAADRRFRYPYINCTDCGPRYSLVLGLPYDRAQTTMREWPLCADCAGEYADPGERRFHAEPVACPACGPRYRLVRADGVAADGGASSVSDDSGGWEAIVEAARLLAQGALVAVKGVGGYHLACDAVNGAAVAALRERKFRKEKPFAVMARDLAAARRAVELDAAGEALLVAAARPIVLAPARRDLDQVAPGNRDLGVMLPYTPLHHLLFAAGAPELLVMTSANRSSEPIAYRDAEALERLAGIADAFLVGERPIARRVDDSVARAGVLGPAILRRSRGYAPGIVARLPDAGPLLAVGADLKNTVTLVVGGEALVSQHVGDLDQLAALEAFRDTARDLVAMYGLRFEELTVVHDLHPQYASTLYARDLPARRTLAVQHHRAHVASVLAERGELARRVLGVALDGTGYGDDGTIWGGEVFCGSVAAGFERVAALRPAALPGGDAAALHPVQAAAGLLAEIDGLPDLLAAPFHFPARYTQARQLVDKGVRTFRTSSAGRLFDTAAALLGFTRAVSYEGQAAIWLEQLARAAPPVADLPFGVVAPGPGGAGRDGAEAGGMAYGTGGAMGGAGAGAAGSAAAGAILELDPRPALLALATERRRGRDVGELARAFHGAVAAGLAVCLVDLGAAHGVDTVVLSGGVFQNELLLGELARRLAAAGMAPWTNQQVPPNDGGISLGQAALVACAAPAVEGKPGAMDFAGPGRSAAASPAAPAPAGAAPVGPAA